MFSLRNDLYRGGLPERFRDLTWVEETVCAIYCCTCHVTRLFHTEKNDQPRVFHGNTCAHDLNFVSTAEILPRVPADVKGMLSVVFVGPRQPLKSLKSLYHVRKDKVWYFLTWLAAHNPLYAKIQLSRENLRLYENDEIPGIEERTIKSDTTCAKRTFEQETAGFEPHFAAELASNMNVQDDSDEPLIECMGVSDVESVKIQGRTFQAAALMNLIRPPDLKPDMTIFSGNTAIGEYNNPDLIMGMFPTLFPYGKGGFEFHQRKVPVLFESQANYYLDIDNRCFRYHESFIFIVMNMIQRRQAHLHTHFAVASSDFGSIAEDIAGVRPATLKAVAKHLQEEGRVADLSVEEKKVFTLLSKVKTISAKVSGSEALKIMYRNEIKVYCGHFNIPHIFFMANPSPQNSPLFQLMCGDTTIYLDNR